MSVAPASATTINFAPVTQDASLGTSFTVAITISGLNDFTAPSLGVFDVDVNFDPSILSFGSVSYGDPILGDQLDLFGLGSLTATTLGTGFVNLFELSLDSIDDLNGSQAGDFTLATLGFDALAVGVSPLRFTVNALGDAEGNTLSADAGTGVANVVQPVPEPALFLLTACALAGIWSTRESPGRTEM
jgi:hypothetical protein